MNYKYRFITGKLHKYLAHFPVAIITGARQVGKTTLLKEVLASSHELIVFDPVIDVENAAREPELFFKNHPGPLVLDEIQYVPQLIPVIKRIVDLEKSPGKFVLTGSQQWGVMKNIAESLAGRAIISNLAGFSLSEICNTQEKKNWIQNIFDPGGIPAEEQRFFRPPFPLMEHIFRGQLPEAQDLPQDLISDFLESYISTYIERDIRLQADISDLQLFNRFYRLCGALSAREMNYSQLGRDIDISPQTAKRWIDILKSTFQWLEIPAYSGSTVKRVSGKPKGYLSDTGLAARSLYISSPRALASHPNWGNLAETLAVTDLLKEISFMESSPGIYHWRSHSGAEVDLILERDGIFFPIEIKATSRPGRKDTLGIKAFRETYPNITISTGVVIHFGDSNLRLSEQDIGISYFSL